MLMDPSNTRAKTYPLTLAAVGEQVCVVDVIGGKNLVRRLLAMGICDGTELEIVQRQMGSGVVVRCVETRWGLGEGMAHKVLVRPVEQSEESGNDIAFK